MDSHMVPIIMIATTCGVATIELGISMEITIMDHLLALMNMDVDIMEGLLMGLIMGNTELDIE